MEEKPNGLKEWEIIAAQSSSSSPSYYDDTQIIFPPMNHEGLSISRSEISDQHDKELLHDMKRETPSDLLESPMQMAEMFGRRMLLAFEAWCSEIRPTYLIGNPKGRVFLSILAATSLAGVIFYSRCRRRQTTSDEKDVLIRLLKEQDKKISQLLHEVSQLNEALSSGGKQQNGHSSISALIQDIHKYICKQP